MMFSGFAGWQLPARVLAGRAPSADNGASQMDAAKNMTYRRTKILTGGLAVCAGVVSIGALAKEGDQPAKRARPPEWSADVLDTFFEDARTKLVGKRPDNQAAATVAPTTLPSNRTADAAIPPGAAWSKLIDAETIETEVKRVGASLADLMTTPGEFKGGGYEACRRHFSELAVLFAIASEYDGDVRWKDVAPALRDLFARAGRNCKVGTDQTYREATQRKQDLADIIAGSRPNVPPAETGVQWGQIADRPPLMQRLEIGPQERLGKWLANEREFRKNRDDIRHESQLIAAIADVIAREGYDYWDDEDYARHVRALREAAADVSAAVELSNYEQAQGAVGRATKACADCHDLYRG
jgi:hypothetical protein